MHPIGVAVIGAGYWGPNLVRNFRASASWDVVAVCDRDQSRAAKIAAGLSDVETSVESVLDREDVQAVAIATPAATHLSIALAAIAAGKHVLVEKPLADGHVDAEDMVAAAQEQGLVLMCDHTYCYTPVVQKIADLVADGSLGDIHFIDSVRINLGLVQPDVNVIWDLAPHDLSILDYILPGGLNPVGVAAHGADPLGAGRECVGYLTLPLASGALAHVHVNWLSPTKIRQMVIGGSRRTLVWDDLNPGQRLSVYDRGVDLEHVSARDDPAERSDAVISYRLGDMHAPALPEREALGAMVEEFAAAIREGRPARTDGRAGARVIKVLEAASKSLASGGALIPLENDVMAGAAR
jgi:predicted dehydrogenase